MPSQLARESVRDEAYCPSATSLDGNEVRSASQGCCLLAGKCCQTGTALVNSPYVGRGNRAP